MFYNKNIPLFSCKCSNHFLLNWVLDNVNFNYVKEKQMNEQQIDFLKQEMNELQERYNQLKHREQNFFQLISKNSNQEVQVQKENESLRHIVSDLKNYKDKY